MITIKVSMSNVPESIKRKVGRNLHLQKNHPIEIVKRIVVDYFKGLKNYNFAVFDNLSPYVSVEDNFDKLLIPKSHPSRSRSDTYYVDDETVLRTQTSSHQNQLLSDGHNDFIVAGDVYRKDEIDSSHYPVFHQMEVVGKIADGVGDAKEELFRVIDGLVEYLFPGCEYRVNDDYFPFTEPSFEYEVKFGDKWMEILGCGIMHEKIVENNGLAPNRYWAMGLGLDRMCCICCDIPDIRYLWSTHKRFLSQFDDGRLHKFQTYSELPTESQDISFFIDEEQLKDNRAVWLQENDFFDIVRDVCGDWIANVEKRDEFFHPKHQKLARMYRLDYSPYDPSLKNPSDFKKKITELQNTVRKRVVELGIELR